MWGRRVLKGSFHLWSFFSFYHCILFSPFPDTLIPHKHICLKTSSLARSPHYWVRCAVTRLYPAVVTLCFTTACFSDRLSVWEYICAYESLPVTRWPLVLTPPQTGRQYARPPLSRCCTGRQYAWVTPTPSAFLLALINSCLWAW